MIAVRSSSIDGLFGLSGIASVTMCSLMSEPSCLAVLRDQRLAHLPERRGPDLAVGVHLGPDQVVADVTEGGRVLVVGPVADAAGLVAGDVTADHRVLLVAAAVQVVQGVPVAPALTHRAGLVGAERAVLGADVAVRQPVGVLVLDDAGVEVAVGAGTLERVVDRLPQEHPAPRRDAVGQRQHVGVVAAGVRRVAAGDGAGLHEALDRVARVARLAEVVELEVAGRTR